MYYVVGQHIDLSYLNKPVETKPDIEPVVIERPKHEFDVGTNFVFKFINGKYQAAINIPVSFA